VKASIERLKELDAATTAVQIKELEKQVKSLQKKLARRDGDIASMRGGMDVTRERRNTIREMAMSLVTALDEARWADVDEVHEY